MPLDDFSYSKLMQMNNFFEIKGFWYYSSSFIYLGFLAIGAIVGYNIFQLSDENEKSIKYVLEDTRNKIEVSDKTKILTIVYEGIQEDSIQVVPLAEQYSDLKEKVNNYNLSLVAQCSLPPNPFKDFPFLVINKESISSERRIALINFFIIFLILLSASIGGIIRGYQTFNKFKYNEIENNKNNPKYTLEAHQEKIKLLDLAIFRPPLSALIGIAGGAVVFLLVPGDYIFNYGQVGNWKSIIEVLGLGFVGGYGGVYILDTYLNRLKDVKDEIDNKTKNIRENVVMEVKDEIENKTKDLQKEQKSIEVKLQEIDTQKDKDHQAIMAVRLKLGNQKEFEAKFGDEKLKALIINSSIQARDRIFKENRDSRREFWKEQKYAKIADCVPIFEALIGDLANDDHPIALHRRYAQLGYALKDQKPHQWQRAIHAFENAISDRNKQLKIEGDSTLIEENVHHLLYEFNLGVSLFEDYMERNPDAQNEFHESGLKEKIIYNLRQSCKDSYIRDEILTLKNPKSKKLIDNLRAFNIMDEIRPM